MSKELVGYFGFGSLVNRHTLRTDFVNHMPARLRGWRRHWQSRTHTLDDPVALLSIHEDESCSINGMIVIDRAENLMLVDEREAGYDRIPIDLRDIEFVNPAGNSMTPIFVPDALYFYVAQEKSYLPGDGMLLQSYIDAVMQGYFNEFGVDGIDHFLDTTHGFDRDMLLDRHAPRYSRAVSLSEEEIQLFDEALRRTGVKGFSTTASMAG